MINSVLYVNGTVFKYTYTNHVQKCKMYTWIQIIDQGFIKEFLKGGGGNSSQRGQIHMICIHTYTYM